MIVIIAIHTIVILVVFPYSYFLNPSKESWPFFFAFFIDFPASILFHKLTSLVKIIINNNFIGFWCLAFAHFFLGAMWWLIIVAGIIKLVNLVKSVK